MNTRFKAVFYILVLAAVLPSPSFGDISVIKEVVIAPKGVIAAGNIGQVNRSVNVRLDSAVVQIHVGKPVKGPSAPVSFQTKGVFELVNESSHHLKLTVGFPVSNSRYSSFQLSNFGVTTDGAVREVFRRTSGYPRQLIHEYVSGEKEPENTTPPDDVTRDSMKLFGDQFMGSESFHNLMVWEETFRPLQRRNIEVKYELEIPLQENTVVRKNVKGSFKGVWPQEANNVPLVFLNKLPHGSYYFFDYYLTSGASWSGPIGFEDITLHFDQWWEEPELYTSIGPEAAIAWSNTRLHPDYPLEAYYAFHDQEPAENIYFALRPGQNRQSKVPGSALNEHKGAR
jgi:hypothetical protein